MTWPNAYVGIPHEPLARSGPTLDCWGLLARVYREQLGIDLPLFDGVHPCQTEIAEIDALLQGGARAAPWRSVEDVQPFDAVLFRMGRYARHVAIAIDVRRMLHSAQHASVIVPLADQPWRHRLIGVYRHEAAQ